LNSKSQSLRIIFAGTPEFALSSLQALIDTKCEVIAVLTQPDRPAGRGKHLQQSPVKKLALENGLHIPQPDSLRDPVWKHALEGMRPDLMGLMIPADILAAPSLGCWNVHASLLPRWRGAAPIQRAIEAGDKETGVCIMQMEVTLYTGPVSQCTTTPIGPTETAGDVHDRLASLGAMALVDCIEKAIKGELAPPTAQDENLAVYAPKLSKAEAELDWDQPADVIERKIRAFDPWPVAWCLFGKQRIRVWQAEVVDSADNCKPGQLMVHGHTLIVGTAEKSLKILELQRAGGQRMKTDQFLNAHHPQSW
jgi:methionyl-tRNA formyltransferase